MGEHVMFAQKEENNLTLIIARYLKELYELNRKLKNTESVEVVESVIRINVKLFWICDQLIDVQEKCLIPAREYVTSPDHEISLENFEVGYLTKVCIEAAQAVIAICVKLIETYPSLDYIQNMSDAILLLIKYKQQSAAELKSFFVTQIDQMTRVSSNISPQHTQNFYAGLYTLHNGLQTIMSHSKDKAAQYLQLHVAKNIYETHLRNYPNLYFLECYGLSVSLVGEHLKKQSKITESYQCYKKGIYSILCSSLISPPLIHRLAIIGQTLIGYFERDTIEAAFYRLLKSLAFKDDFKVRPTFALIFQVSKLNNVLLKAQLSQLLSMFMMFVLKIDEQKLLPDSQLKTYLKVEANRSFFLKSAQELAAQMVPSLQDIIEWNPIIRPALIAKVTRLEKELKEIKTINNDLKQNIFSTHSFFEEKEKIRIRSRSDSSLCDEESAKRVCYSPASFM